MLVCRRKKKTRNVLKQGKEMMLRDLDVANFSKKGVVTVEKRKSKRKQKKHPVAPKNAKNGE